MPLHPAEHDRKYGALDQVLRSHLGRLAHDPAALDAYLRHTWRSGPPWAIAVAEAQLREFAQHPPGRVRMRLGEFYEPPDLGLAEGEFGDFLLALADRLAESLAQGPGSAEGPGPLPTPPLTHWEWHARFPELGQLLGGWFSQDTPDEFGDHATALGDYLDGTDGALVARLSGELHELLALPLDESALTAAVATLGMEVAPPAPYSVGAWLEALAAVLHETATPRPS
ncbi:contact-dependent growth inhibition system immunity protein [Streptomyces sp. BE308]|uniref:contact-dependent growth inhibition system immunity protein n=1 Tax=Streptomyces sp. BE308 TaxID=3002529 RepID=UPI002E77FA1B|nr:contact-dependent growth inhibition system immunity protein [Streptomyces sp. BE308]MEE1794877.1 contact-dependent growth inhibition system immunity protein [Streptomyces sp. BE308]